MPHQAALILRWTWRAPELAPLLDTVPQRRVSINGPSDATPRRNGTSRCTSRTTPSADLEIPHSACLYSFIRAGVAVRVATPEVRQLVLLALRSEAAHPSTSCWPPSMSKVAPVTAVLVMRWRASAAMSLGPTTRRIGSVVRSCSRRASSWSAEQRRRQAACRRTRRDQVHADGCELEREVLRHGGHRGRERRDEREARRRPAATRAAHEEQGPARADAAGRISGDLQRQQEVGVDVAAGRARLRSPASSA